MKWSVLLIALVVAASHAEVVVDRNAAPRVRYGAEQLEKALRGLSQKVTVETGAGPGPEGFLLRSREDGIEVSGADDSGAMYGCLELARRITQTKSVPRDLNFSDAPAFKLRGPCIGMQKTTLLPGRRVYEYPYTPELFPFFY